MSRRFVIAAALVAAFAGASAIALAQGPGPRGPFPGGPMAPGMRPGGPPDLGLRGVQLTDEQREQVRSIMDSHKAELDEIGSKLRDAHRALAEAVDATTV